MRRLILAILATVSVTGGVATLTKAQLAQPAPTPAIASPGSGEPVRSARYLLRNGLDYLQYNDDSAAYERGLHFLEQAKAQQIELNTTERAQLAKGMELAKSKLRELAAKAKAAQAQSSAEEEAKLRPTDGTGALVDGESLMVPAPVKIPPLEQPGALAAAPIPEPAPLSAEGIASDALLPEADQEVPQGALDNLPPSIEPPPVLSPEQSGVGSAPPIPSAPAPIAPDSVEAPAPSDTAAVVPAETPGPLSIDLKTSPLTKTAKVSKRRAAPPRELPPLEVGSRKALDAAPKDDLVLAQSEAELPELPTDPPLPAADQAPVPVPAPADAAAEDGSLPPLPLELNNAPAPVVVPEDPAPVPVPEAVPVPEVAPAPELPAEPAPAPAPRRSRSTAPAPREAQGQQGAPLSDAIMQDVNRMARRQRSEVEGSEANRSLPPQGTGSDTLGGDASARETAPLVVPRAPSPTEPQPLRSIPAPEEFTRLPKREFKPYRKLWAASGTCHTTLYFQDPVLERYGQPMEDKLGRAGKFLSYPIDDPTQTNQRQSIAQPFFSFGLLGFQIATMPYKLIVDPPWEAEYDLGYWRPGDVTPRNLYYLPAQGVGPPGAGANYR